MARFKHEFDRDKTEQGRRVAVDSMFENDGYKKERIATVTRRAAHAAELAKLAELFER